MQKQFIFPVIIAVRDFVDHRVLLSNVVNSVGRCVKVFRIEETGQTNYKKLTTGGATFLKVKS